MVFVGFEEIHSKKNNQDYVILYSTEEVNPNQGLGTKCYSDFVSADLVKDYDLKLNIGHNIDISYNRNKFITSVSFS